VWGNLTYRWSAIGVAINLSWLEPLFTLLRALAIGQLSQAQFTHYSVACPLNTGRRLGSAALQSLDSIWIILVEGIHFCIRLARSSSSGFFFWIEILPVPHRHDSCLPPMTFGIQASNASFNPLRTESPADGRFCATAARIMEHTRARSRAVLQR
jgi:hypothetical protein